MTGEREGDLKQRAGRAVSLWLPASLQHFFFRLWALKHFGVLVLVFGFLVLVGSWSLVLVPVLGHPLASSELAALLFLQAWDLDSIPGARPLLPK